MDQNVTIRIRANSDGTMQVLNGTARAVDGVGRSANTAAQHMREMGLSTRNAGEAIRNLAVGLGSMQSAKEIVMLADKMTLLDAKIRIAAGSIDNYRIASERIVQISLETGTSLEANATMFGRLNKAILSMGGTVENTLGLTKTLSQALVVSGASAGEARSVMIQLSQALSSGVLRGDEFNSIMENGSRVVDALSKSMGKSRGELRAMAEAGALSAATVINALQDQSRAVDEDFSKIPLTIGRALENINTNWAVFIQNINESTLSTGFLAEKLQLVAEFIKDFDSWITGSNAIQDNIAELNSKILKKAAESSKYPYDTKLKEELDYMILLRGQLTDSIKTQAAEQKKLNGSAIAGTQAEIKVQEQLKTIQQGKYKDQIIAGANKYGVDPNIMLAIAQRETASGFNIKQSSAGAQGLMQIMPDTAAELAKEMHTTTDMVLHDIQTNANAAALYVSQKMKELQKAGKLTIENLAAAYNAGFGGLQNAGFNPVNFTGRMAKETAPYMIAVKELYDALNKLSGTDYFKTQAEGAKKAGDEAKSFKEESIKLTEQLQNGVEKYNATIDDLRARLNQPGGIDQKTFDLGLDAANKKLMDYVDGLDTTKQHVEAVKAAYADWQSIFNQAIGYQNAAKSSTEKYVEELNKLVAVYNSAANAGNGLMSENVFSANLGIIQDKYQSDNLKANNDALKEYNALIKQISESTGQLGATNDTVLNSALGGVNLLISAFDNLDKSLRQNTLQQQKLLEGHNLAVQEIDKIPSDADRSKQRIAEEQKYNDASKKLTEDRKSIELGAIGTIVAAAAQGYAQSANSQMAANRATVISTATALASAVQLAVANQAGSGDPYTVWARVAAVVALLGSYGISSSSPSTPAIDTKTQGTVLGDRTKSSSTTEDIAKIMQDIHASEYLALLNINDSIKGLNKAILSAVTGVFQRGEMSTPNLPANTTSMYINTTNEVSQNILRGAGNTLGAILDGWMFDLEQFVETKKTTRYFIGTRVKTNATTNDVSDQTNRDVTDIFKNIGKVLIDAGEIFGTDVNDAVKNLKIPNLAIDIKGMTGEEATKYINAYISTTIDNLAEDVFPLLKQYQAIGEGMGTTVVRVAGDVGVVTSVFDNLGVQLPKTAEGLIHVSEALVSAAGGIDTLQTGLDNFYRKFYSEQDQFQTNQKFLTENLARKPYYMELPEDRAGYRALTESKLTQSGNDADLYASAKKQLDAAFTAAYEPWLKHLEIRKANAEKYGGEDLRLYQEDLKKADAAAEAATKSNSDYVATLKESADKSASSASLLLEQSNNADQYYKTLEDNYSKLSETLGVLFSTTTDADLVGKQFTTTVNYLAEAFGDADKAASSLSSAMKLVYKDQELKDKTIASAQSAFDQAAKNNGLEGLKVDDFKAGLKFVLEHASEYESKGQTTIDYAGKTLNIAGIIEAEKYVTALENAQKMQVGTTNQATNDINQASDTTQDLTKSLADFLKPFKDSAATRGMTNYQKSLYTLQSTYDSNITKANGLKAAQTDLDLITEQYTLDLKALQKAETDRMNAMVKTIQDAYGLLRVDDLVKNVYSSLSGLVDTFKTQIQQLSDSYESGDTSTTTLAAVVNAAFDTIRYNSQKLVDQLNKDYQTKFDAITAKNRSINENITLLTKGQSAVDEMKRVQAIFDLQSDSYDKQMTAVDTLQSLVMDNYSKQIDAVKTIKNYLSDLALNKTLSPLSKADQLTESQSQMMSLYEQYQKGNYAVTQDLIKSVNTYLENARSYYDQNNPSEAQLTADRQMVTDLYSRYKAGDTSVAPDLTSSANTLLQNARNYYGTNADYVKIYDEVTNALKGLMGSDANKSTQDLQLDAAKQAVVYLEMISTALTGSKADSTAITGTDSVINRLLDKKIEDIGKVLDSAAEIIAKFAEELNKILKPTGLTVDATGSTDAMKAYQDMIKAGLERFTDAIKGSGISEGLAGQLQFESAKLAENLEKFVLAGYLKPEDAERIFKGQTSVTTSMLEAFKAGTASEDAIAKIWSDNVTFLDSVANGLLAGTISVDTIKVITDYRYMVEQSVIDAVAQGKLSVDAAGKFYNDLQTIFGTLSGDIKSGSVDLNWSSLVGSASTLLNAINTALANAAATIASTPVPQTPTTITPPTGTGITPININPGTGTTPTGPTPTTEAFDVGYFESIRAKGPDFWWDAALYAKAHGFSKGMLSDYIGRTGGDYQQTWDFLTMKGYASGGLYPGGLALVGEQGPEVINFGNPGQVYTAPQTRELLSGDNSEVVAELRATVQELRTQNQHLIVMINDLRKGFDQNNKDNRRQADSLETIERKTSMAS